MIEDKLNREERIRLECIAQAVARSRMNNTIEEIVRDAKTFEEFIIGEEQGMADWMWDEELAMHIPCCSVIKPDTNWRCGNGPLTGLDISLGDCGEDTHPRRVIR